MPDAYRLSISALVDAAGEAAALGIPTIAVNPAVAPALYDPDGHEAVNPNNLVCRAVAALKQAVPNSACCATWRSTRSPRTAMTGDPRRLCRERRDRRDPAAAAIVSRGRLRHHRPPT
jgi:hypothetical protein